MNQVTTLCAAFQRTAAARPDATALRMHGVEGGFTWRQYADEVERIAGGLASLGVRRGDTVATMLTNRPEFNLAETAASHLGAATFSVYNTSSPEQLRFLLTDAGARVIVTERAFADQIRAAAAPVDHVLVLEDGDLERLSPADDFDFEAAWQAVRPEDVLCLIYTSGTTGDPKGVELTHANMLALAEQIVAVFPIGPDDIGVSYLPSAHIADRGMGHYFVNIYGAEVTCVPDLKALAEVLPVVRPTFFVAVPRVWEKLKFSVDARLSAQPEVKVAFEAGNEQVAGGLRAALGFDRLNWALTGGGAVPPDVYDFLTRLGVPLSEAWGMSECGLGSGAAPGVAKHGSIGPVLPGMEAKVLEDGELLVRGPNVMRGYRGRPQQTAEAVDADGWLHTGDVVTMDDEGYITIIDRKKELIISAAGKNMSPSNIENVIKQVSPLIGQLTVIGDGKPYNIALVVLDHEVVAAQGLADDPAELAESESIRKLVNEAVEAGNSRLSRAEQVKRYTILPTFWEPGGEEVTATMKLRRRNISAKYAEQIEQLYAQPRDQ